MSTVQDFQDAFMSKGPMTPHTDPNLDGSKVGRANSTKEECLFGKGRSDFNHDFSKRTITQDSQKRILKDKGYQRDHRNKATHNKDFGYSNNSPKHYEKRDRNNVFYNNKINQSQMNPKFTQKENFLGSGKHDLLKDAGNGQNFLTKRESNNINLGLEKFFGKRNQVRDKIMKNQTLIRHINALGGIENTFESKFRLYEFIRKSGSRESENMLKDKSICITLVFILEISSLENKI